MKINVSKKNITIAIAITSVVCIVLAIFMVNTSNWKFRKDYNQSFSFSEKKMIINYFEAVDEYVDIIEKSSDLTNTEVVNFLDENIKTIEKYEANKAKIKEYGDKLRAETPDVSSEKKLMDSLRKSSILTYYHEIDIKILEAIEQLVKEDYDGDYIKKLKEKVEDTKDKFFISEK